MFKCDKCGLCCMNLARSDIYSDLDRGDGVCRYLEEDTHLCKIYDTRPLKCNVEKMFEVHFKNVITKEEYYNLNYIACKELKEKRGE